MTPFNATMFRQQFPALRDAAVYLDSAATTLKPQPVIDAVQQFYSTENATVHRSQHQAARALTQRFEHTREQVAALLHAQDPRAIVWTKGTTEAINLVAQSYARPRLQPGDEIIVSEAEHHANLIPWLMVAQQTGARVIKLPIGADWLPEIAQLADLLTPKTRLLALGQMSNVTGGQPDLAKKPFSLPISTARWLWSMAHRAWRTVHLTFRRWILIFMRFPHISCMRRPGWACYTGKPHCWSRWLPGKAAAR
ncbi:aminotransferase class V [Brenneria salicis ATCC 15712 = DSM 30166]|uniref:Aminotransferase class V n=1 Tax=Brenneria salicis ATCC 15712 = DSM 30166 TaxID=714314 RepID=A0A366I7H6_9GAMM|nr:aminotransferase class V [Brenneria salicis ATCC 15712 = DSM 30166]